MVAFSPTPGDAHESAPETLPAEVIERAIDSIPLPGDMHGRCHGARLAETYASEGQVLGVLSA